jgi:hypothetical protein
MKNFLSLGFLAAWGVVAAAPLRADLETYLESDPPPIEGGVSHVNNETSQGMAWKWNPADGRRDYGQIFPVERSFSANELAVQVLFSDPFRAAVRAPFQLDFLHFPSGGPGDPPEVITTLKGELPPNPGLGTGESAWLRMQFPEGKFRRGETYGFLLRFLKEGAAEQHVIFRVTPSSTPDGGHGLMIVGGGDKIEKGPSMNFLLGRTDAGKSGAVRRGPATLVVNRLAPSGLRTIASAVAEAQPGDTIRLAPGSGPYRETLFIRKSGTPGNPIIFDGSGETVTGFEPLTFVQKDGEWTCDLGEFFSSRPNIQGFRKTDGRWTNKVPGAFPAVLAHHGRRIFQNATTGEFEGVRLSHDGTRLTLLPGTDPEGWEISARDQVVMILNVSHHVYKNLKATGSLNDGFNLHGSGSGLVFENIEGSQNLDEGFSAHDTILCSVNGGRFCENDNGIGNVGDSVMTAKKIETSDNAGWGIWLLNCRAELEDVKSWDNGVAQIALHGRAHASVQNVEVGPAASASKPRLSYQESATRSDSRSYEVAPTAVCEGTIATMPVSETRLSQSAGGSGHSGVGGGEEFRRARRSTIRPFPVPERP